MRYLYCILMILFSFISIEMSAQTDRREVRKGNREFKKGDWAAADVSYRKALLKDSTSFAANYNLANNLYRQNNFDEAKKYLDKLEESAPASAYSSDYYYNTGNVSAQKKDWQSAVQAYKQALLRNPSDMDAKENYIYAKKMLEQQQNQQNKDDKDKQNDKQNDKNNQDKQDQNKDNKDNKDNQDNNDRNNQNNQDKNNPDNQNNDGGQNPENRNGAGSNDSDISQQRAQQILQAIQAKEKETQDKVNKEKAAVLKSKKKEKNW